MPIYEFKCLECGNCIEFLIIGKGEKTELKCEFCSSKNLERIISSTNYTISDSKEVKINKNKKNNMTRTCSSGSCTTYNIPGSF